jgi:DNA adenine methylase
MLIAPVGSSTLMPPRKLLHADNTVQLPPPLKWAGGKRWLIPHLLPLWQATPSTTRLIEPFCGGLAVALGLQPKTAWLNDANPHLINFYQHVQAGLVLQPEGGPPLLNDRDYYNASRERFNALIIAKQANTPEGARLLYYLNRTGFNGLCRFNQQGLYNVPFGRYATINYPLNLLAHQSVLAPWQFSMGDFETMTPQITPTDWVYADPPYDVAFVTYSQGGFSWTDQVRLAHWLASLPCPVVASNQATPRMMDLYQGLGFSVQTLLAPRRIACNGDRQPAQEMLALKR